MTKPRDKALKLVAPSASVLRARCTPVERREHVMSLARSMLATLQVRRDGVALAAPQVGRTVRLVVTAAGLAVADPVFDVDEDAPVENGYEGCLSFPGQLFEVPRATAGRLRGIDVLTGKFVSSDLVGFDARMWQHEVSHLDGIVLADHYQEVLPA